MLGYFRFQLFLRNLYILCWMVENVHIEMNKALSLMKPFLRTFRTECFLCYIFINPPSPSHTATYFKLSMSHAGHHIPLHFHICALWIIYHLTLKNDCHI
jgi:hypothetical protein